LTFCCCSHHITAAAAAAAAVVVCCCCSTGKCCSAAARATVPHHSCNLARLLPTQTCSSRVVRVASSWQEGDSDDRGGDRSYSSRGRGYSDRRDRDSYGGGGGSRGDSYSSRGRSSGGRRSGGRGRGGGRGGTRPGDWRCPECGYNNFASKTECNSCSAPRPENLPRYDAEPQQREVKAGDWDCEGGCVCCCCVHSGGSAGLFASTYAAD
jgi:hypothetical protein